MSRILTITILSLMLAGCADTYSRTAMPKGRRRPTAGDCWLQSQMDRKGV